MTTTFDEARRVGNRAPLTLRLPGADAEHRLDEKALVGGSGVFVTDNLKDFPTGMNAQAGSRSSGKEGQSTFEHGGQENKS